MAEEYYKIPKDPQYRAAAIRKLQDSDPASATLIFNPLIEALLESLAHVQVHKAALGEDGKVDASQLPEMDASNFTYDGQPLDEFLDEVKVLARSLSCGGCGGSNFDRSQSSKEPPFLG